MLFDLKPKDSPKALFGREKELAEITRLIEAGRWVTVLGPRMVGKTSLLKAAQAKLHCQTVYVNLWGARGIQGLLNAMVQSINSSMSLSKKIKEMAGRIEGLSVGPGGLSVTIPRRPLITLWNLIDLLGREENALVIELDEVQELANVSGQFLKVLANIFNTHPKVVFVFSGSMFGLIRTLLHPPSSRSPMFGRPPAEVYLESFGRTQAEAFLKQGFQECGIKPNPDILNESVFSKLDGNPGWLTLYGNNIAVGKLPPEVALQKTEEQGIQVVREELEHFLEGRERNLNLAVLSALVVPSTWSDVKAKVEKSRSSPVSDPSIQSVLKNLEDGLLIEHIDKAYQIVDPMLRALLLSGSIS